MAPVWHKQEGVHSLLFSIITTLVLYSISLGILIILARLVVLLGRKYLAITSEATLKAWVICTSWLAVSHLFAIYTLYDHNASLVSILIWAVVATCGLTIGLGLAGGIITAAIIICYKYL